MTKKSISRLLQATLMCCLTVLFTACDDIFASEDNPTPAYLSMSEAPVTLKAGDTFKRKAISVTTAVVEYTSSDTNVATVDNSGLVTAIAEGEATITATATGYSSQTGKKIFLTDSKSYNVTVLPAIDPMLSTPLTLEALTSGTIKVNSPKEGMQYTLNDGAKTPVTTTAIDVAEGDKVAFYGSGTSITCYNGTHINGGTANIKAYGNIMSLLDEDNFATATTLATERTFYELFDSNNKLIDASGLLLPATTLTKDCYRYMFWNCTSMTAAPALPATTLTQDCYKKMFYGCSSLTEAPALPATQLAEGCYNGMFTRCYTLTTAPALPATTLTQECYSNMFEDCSSLTEAHALPATTLAKDCYRNMFYGCSSLTTAPALPATELAESCYMNMFYNCSSLTTTPTLPATQLAENCYNSMFYNCSNLTTAYVKAGYDFYKCATIFFGCPNLNTCTLYTDGDWSGYVNISNWTKVAYPTE